MAQHVAHNINDLETIIREQIATASVSIREISRQTGISKTHLSNFKNGERNLSFQNLDFLATYLGVKYTLKNF